MGKTAVNDAFYSKYKFKFSLVLRSSGDNIGGIALAGDIGSKICISWKFLFRLSLLKAQMNLNTNVLWSNGKKMLG